MTKPKLALGPQVTIDKEGKSLYWIDRKRVKKSVYESEVASLKQSDLLTAIEIDYGSGIVHTATTDLKIHSPEPAIESYEDQRETVLDQLDELLLEVRRLVHYQPNITDKERTFLALCQMQDAGYHAGYAEALTVAGSPMAANALIGSLQRKGLVRYESKEEARYRLISTEDRFYHLTSPEVQQARIIEPTMLGVQAGNAQLAADLNSVV